MYSKASKSIEKLHALRDRAARLGGSARTVFRGKINDRATVVSLAAAGVLTVGFVAGSAALVSNSATPQAQTVAVADVTARKQAADRADRASRTAPAQAPKSAAAALVAPALPAAPAPDWVIPMPGAELSSCFGPRWGTQHMGIDFAAPADTVILSVGAGTVFAAGWNYTGYGISIVIDHGNGYFSHYAHASKALVSPGDAVKPGQPLALEGSTGDSTGPHLHFEIHQGMWHHVEPASWLREHGVKIGC